MTAGYRPVEAAERLFPGIRRGGLMQGMLRARAACRGNLVMAALLAGVFSVALALACPVTASARFRPGQAHDPRGLFTEVTLTGTGSGSTVSGGVAPAGFNPLSGYPDSIPAGSKILSGVFAGTLVI